MFSWETWVDHWNFALEGQGEGKGSKRALDLVLEEVKFRLTSGLPPEGGGFSSDWYSGGLQTTFYKMSHL